MYNSKVCNRCHGEGYLLREDARGHEYEVTCPSCDGYGDSEKSDKEDVEIAQISG